MSIKCANFIKQYNAQHMVMISQTLSGTDCVLGTFKFFAYVNAFETHNNLMDVDIVIPFHR